LGFFIVVKRDRIWLPTEDTGAEVHPVSVHLVDAPAKPLKIGDLPYTVH
jgi:hypothetical protein